jgi:hypothetical protein
VAGAGEDSSSGITDIVHQLYAGNRCGVVRKRELAANKTLAWRAACARTSRQAGGTTR